MSTLAAPSANSPFSPYEMARPSIRPSLRTLALLALAVLLVHVFVLRQRPDSFAPATNAARAAPAFNTRRIETPPPAQLAQAPAPEAARPAPRPKPRPAPKREANEPAAQVQPAPVATDLIADPVSTPSDVQTPPEPVPPEKIAKVAPPEPPAQGASAPALPTGPTSTPVTAMVLPASVVVGYRMTGVSKGMTYQASAELAWQNTSTMYNASMTVSALFLGSRSMTSTGTVSPEGLAPIRFSDKSRSEVAAHFDPDKNQVTFSANTPSAPWIPGTQDRVSLFMQLAGMLAGNPEAFPIGSMISVYTVGPRDADTWTFKVEGGEKLTLPFGEIPTVKLARQPRREFDQKVEIWYAPSLGYLPVRNKITQANGDFVDQQLESLK